MTWFEKVQFFFGIVPKRFIITNRGKHYDTWFDKTNREYWVLERKTGRFLRR